MAASLDAHRFVRRSNVGWNTYFFSLIACSTRSTDPGRGPHLAQWLASIMCAMVKNSSVNPVLAP
jgi:hypothetical protein